MPIIRVQKHTSPYVIIEKTGLDDTRLSFCARGILAYLISKPDDWSISYKQLEQHSPSEGRRAIANAMQELLDAGYASRTRERGKRGRMEGWVTTIYENPTAGPSPDRHTASGQSVGPASLLAENTPSTSLANPTDIPLTDSRKAVSLPRNDLTKKKERIPPPYIPPQGGDVGVSGFAQFWDLYPRKVKKARAAQLWAQLGCEAQTERIAASVHAHLAHDPHWSPDAKGRTFIPFPATYLNDARWEDEITAPVPVQTNLDKYLATMLKTHEEEEPE